MKEINFNPRSLSIIALLMLFAGCTKDKIAKVDVSSIDQATLDFRSVVFGEVSDLADADGYIFFSNRSVNSCLPGTSLSVGGKFGSQGGDFGGLRVNGYNIPTRELTEGGEEKVIYSHRWQPSDGEGGENQVLFEFLSSDIGYASFSTDLYFPERLCVTSSLGEGDHFPKNEDLLIEWDPDPNTEKVYIAVCAAGSPCIFKETSDTGQYVIPKNAFIGFNVGSRVFVLMGRGDSKVVTQTNNKEIVLATARIAIFPSTYVTD